MTESDKSGRPLILITRPSEDAAPFLDSLSGHGLDGMIEPMLTIEAIADAPVDLADCRAILFTSANGVRQLAQRTDRRDLPVMTVGPASARAARAAGFEDVEASGGDVEALVASVQARFPVEGGPFFHAAGSVTAGDLKGTLEGLGYAVRRVPLYSAKPAESLSKSVRTAWDSGRIDAVAFFSPRTASTFVRLLTEEGRASRARTVHAACLSAAVAKAAEPVDWAGSMIASSTDSDTLAAELAAYFNKNQPLRAGTMADQKDTSENTNEAESPDQVAEPVETIDTDAVIEAFGGIRPMAAKLDVAVSTVQGWKTRAHIPETRWRDIIAAADAHQIDLSIALSPPAKPADEDPVEEVEIDGTAETVAETQSEEAQSEEAQPEDTQPEIPQEEAPVAADEPVSREETSAEAPKPAAPAASGGGKLALLVGAAALAAVVTRPVWAPYVDPHLAKYLPIPATETSDVPAPAPGADPALVAELQAQLGVLQNRIAEVESRPATIVTETGDVTVPPVPQALLDRVDAAEAALSDLAAATAGLDALRAETAAALAETKSALQASLEADEGARNRLIERLGVMESRLEQMAAETERAMAGVAGLEAVIGDQGDQIAALERRPAIEGAAQAGLALAVGDIETALHAGRPFAAALARLGSLAEGDGTIDAATAGLQPFAETGVPTRVALTSAFGRDAASMQVELDKIEGGTLETLWNGAQSLISIRRKGDAPEAPPVSRAEAALALGDLSGAVAALAPVREQSATVAGWLTGAEARLAAEAALGDLRRAVAFGLNGSQESDLQETVAPEADAPAETETENGEAQ